MDAVYNMDAVNNAVYNMDAVYNAVYNMDAGPSGVPSSGLWFDSFACGSNRERVTQWFRYNKLFVLWR